MKTAVVVCNGPSLAEVPNEWLDQFTTFGHNRIHLKDGFIPTYLSICDNVMAKTPEMVYPILDMIPKVEHTFLTYWSASAISEIYPLPNEKISVFFLRQWSNRKTGEILTRFGTNPLKHLVHGYTVTYFTMQIAAWMGYKRLLCVGLDHDYGGADHFHPDYNEADIDYSTYNEWWDARTRPHFECARAYFESVGGEVINCTPNSKLNVFPITDWRDYGRNN